LEKVNWTQVSRNVLKGSLAKILFLASLSWILTTPLMVTSSQKDGLLACLHDATSPLDLFFLSSLYSFLPQFISYRMPRMDTLGFCLPGFTCDPYASPPLSRYPATFFFSKLASSPPLSRLIVCFPPPQSPPPP